MWKNVDKKYEAPNSSNWQLLCDFQKSKYIKIIFSDVSKNNFVSKTVEVPKQQQ